MIRDGYTSFKIYMTYDRLRLDDMQILDVLSTAREHRAFVMVHAENHDMIRWLRQRLLDRGHVEPRYHAVSHPTVGEGEAANRAIALSRLMDIPILIVHVSSEPAMAEIWQAQTSGLKIFGETCAQYLCLTANDLDRESNGRGKILLQPASEGQGVARSHLARHSQWHIPGLLVRPCSLSLRRNRQVSRRAEGEFHQLANGLPGIELRVPLLFSEGVGKGRIDIHKFVELTATNPAKIYGLYPRKGSIVIGGDADIAIWDPEKEVTVTHDMLHDACDYTPYEGMRVKGWPVTVLSRGRIAVQSGELKVTRGSGMFLKREISAAAIPLGASKQEVDPSAISGPTYCSPRH